MEQPAAGHLQASTSSRGKHRKAIIYRDKACGCATRFMGLTPRFYGALPAAVRSTRPDLYKQQLAHTPPREVSELFALGLASCAEIAVSGSSRPDLGSDPAPRRAETAGRHHGSCRQMLTGALKLTVS